MAESGGEVEEGPGVYREQKGGEVLAARRGRSMEWVKCDDLGEWGRQRIGWICKVHGWGYWVRQIRWDDGKDEDARERERNTISLKMLRHERRILTNKIIIAFRTLKLKCFLTSSRSQLKVQNGVVIPF